VLQEALPVEIGPVEELLTFAALAPERLEEKSGPRAEVRL